MKLEWGAYMDLCVIPNEIVVIGGGTGLSTILRGIKNLISVLAMLGRREYTVVNDIKLIRM